jgi:hypothetical protein
LLDFTKQLTVSAALFETYTDCSQRSIAMAQSTKPPIFDVIDIEREIEEEFRKLPAVREAHSTSAPELAMPDYVEHKDGATEIGRLSAEAVVREYEAAAKDIEDLPRCAHRHRGTEGNCGQVSRRSQARLPSYRELFACHGGGPQDLR